MPHRRLFALVGTTLLVANSMALATSPDVDGRVPDGLSVVEWSSIRAVFDANRHAAVADDGGFHARNPAQQWQMRFDGRGFVATPDSGDWSWGLELVSYGREDAEQAVAVPMCVSADGGRVSYEWDDALTEWYINDGRGLEHGYNVHKRPAVALASFTGKALRFVLAVRGGLRPRVSGNCRGVTFVDAGGASVVHYNGLIVFDADGVTLPAWFEPATIAGRPATEALRLSVDDTGARYPLTIDPIGQQAYLKASNTETGDGFGYAVAISGDTVVVAAIEEDSSATGVDGDQADNGAYSSGAAYVFLRNGTTWSQQAYLKASNTDSNDAFGRTVAISGDTVVVGASSEASNAIGVDGNQADNSAVGTGAAYVFVRNGTIWSQQAYLKASNAGQSDHFGYSVDISGNTIVVGAYREDSSATGVDGNQIDDGVNFNTGAAYVFVRSGMTWSQQAYLKASNTEVGDIFGISVAISGETVVIGASGEDSSAAGVDGNQADNGTDASGAVYVFARNGTTWSQQAYIKASLPGQGDSFGSVVAISDDTIVIGAEREDSNATGVNGNQTNNSVWDSGAAYVFVRSGTTWSQQAYLKASNSGMFDFFGGSVSVSNDMVVVGAHLEDSSATGVNGSQGSNFYTDSGAAYVFVRSGTVWNQQAYLKASNTGASDSFGFAVDVSGETVVVGARSERSSATGVDGDQANNSAIGSGAVYVFVVLSNATATLTSSPNPSVFGQAVTFTATVLANPPSSLIPNGTIMLKDGATPIGTAALNAWGVATLSSNALTAGVHLISASYDGGNSFNASSSAPFNHTVLADTDGDGTPDVTDGCPNDPLKIEPGQCVCGVPDTDTDGDGAPDCHDSCPEDPHKIGEGWCGCEVPDTDTDGDQTPNCSDACVDDPFKTYPGVCGCGVSDINTDGDLLPDCFDPCPVEPFDNDSDSDGVCIPDDECPHNPDRIVRVPGACGCNQPDEEDGDQDGIPDCAEIPTASFWGLIVLALGLLTTAKVRFRPSNGHN